MNTEEEVAGRLRAGIESIPAQVPPGLARRAYGRNRRRRAATRAVAAAGTVAAAGVAVVLVASSAPRSAAPAVSGSQALAGSGSQAPVVNSALMSLAAHITASSGSVPGDASLVIQTRTLGSQPPLVSYNLYTDSGTYYGGDTKSYIMWEFAHHKSLADSYDANAVAAARYAATGDLTTARTRMALAQGGNPLGLGLSPAARQKIYDEGLAQAKEILKEKGAKNIKLPANPPTGKALQSQVDNYVWMNSTDALTVAGGDPQVRAGVLRLLSTISGVTVTNSTTNGQPTLTLTAGPKAFGGGGGKNVVVINAQTGVPISSWSGDLPPAQNGTPTPSSTTTYQVSRVTLANIEAGKF